MTAQEAAKLTYQYHSSESDWKFIFEIIENATKEGKFMAIISSKFYITRKINPDEICKKLENLGYDLSAGYPHDRFTRDIFVFWGHK